MDELKIRMIENRKQELLLRPLGKLAVTLAELDPHQPVMDLRRSELLRLILQYQFGPSSIEEYEQQTGKKV